MDTRPMGTPNANTLERPALVYLRGQGEASWVSHGAPDARLTPTPAGLECAIGDAWSECLRQGRRGLLVLGDDHEELATWVGLLQGDGHPDDHVPLRLNAVAWHRSDGSLADWARATHAGDGDVDLGKLEAPLAAGGLLICIEDIATAPEALACILESIATGPPNRFLLSGPLTMDRVATRLAPVLLELQLWPQAERTSGSVGTARAPRELMTLPAGSFSMGSPPGEAGRWADEGPVRAVTVPSFCLGRHAVTNAAFAPFLEDSPEEAPPAYWSDARFNASDQPVVGVGFDQANRFARWAGCRLPSEAEWEYACRAGSLGPRYGALDEVAWHAGNSGGQLHAVGHRLPNDWGLHDMLGNTWEWVADERHDTYENAPSDARAWIDGGGGTPTRRLLRGGSWADGSRTVRSATRLTDHPGPRVGNVGLRLAADAT